VGTPSRAGGLPPSGPAAGPVPGSLLDLGPAGGGEAGAAALSGFGGQGGQGCPNCGAVPTPGALFCEDCGYDFTTGQLPRRDPLPAQGPPDEYLPPDNLPPPLLSPLPPPSEVPAEVPAAGPPSPAGPVEWVAEVWIDPGWHAVQEVGEPCPSPGMPQTVPLRGASQLVGRRSVNRNIYPQIDCGADTGVSRRHAQLTTDGQRWWVEDLQSANGTYIGTAGSPLPENPVSPGQRTELPDDARVYVGAWTRIVVRPATGEERVTAG
jgi:hypothetical protein